MLTHATDFSVAIVMADIALVLITGLLLARPLRRLRQPPVIAQILAESCFGPSVLGQLPGDLPHKIFPAAGRPLLAAIAELGLLLFMFLVGWQVDLPSLRLRQRSVAAVSLSSTAISFMSGAALAGVLYRRHQVVHGHHIAAVPFTLFVGAAMAVTAFFVLARILVEHQLQFTPAGLLTMASAAVADVLCWSMLAVVTRGPGVGPRSHDRRTRALSNCGGSSGRYRRSRSMMRWSVVSVPGRRASAAALISLGCGGRWRR